MTPSRRNSLGKCEPHLNVIYVSRPRRLSTSHDMRREHLRGVEVTDFARVRLAAVRRAAASRAASGAKPPYGLCLQIDVDLGQ